MTEQLSSDVWSVVAGNVLYAQRATKAEAQRVRDEQYDLAKKFGLPVRVVHTVVSIKQPLAPGGQT